MREWKLATVDEVATEVTVGHVGPMADEYVEQGIPFLRSLSVEPFGIKTEGMKFISRNFHERLKKSALRPGDVVIVRTGKPGACAVVPEWLKEANCSDLVIIRCNEKVRPRFLCYIVNSVAGYHISTHTVGAVQQHFNVGSARTLKFRLPPLNEQDNILSLLGALDDKIEQNRRMNETLEAMTRAIYKDWFVDFAPTRAKQEGRDPYLAPDLWSLFSACLDTDGKPDGWEEKAFAEIVEILSGGTPATSKNEYWGGNIPWFSVADVSSDGSAFVHRTEKTITHDGASNSAAKLVQPGTTIISARGTVGKLAIAAAPMTFNQSCYGLRGREPVGDYFVYLTTSNMVSNLQALAHGSVFSTITRQSFDAIMLARPTNAVLLAFERMVAPLFDRQKANGAESHTLAATRDLLLPKLMSGEVRVRDAEKVVGGVA